MFFLILLMSHKYTNQWSHLDKNRFSRKTHIHHLFRCAGISWIEDVSQSVRHTFLVLQLAHLWGTGRVSFDSKFEAWDPWDNLPEWCQDKRTKIQLCINFFGYEPSNQEQSAAAANNWFLLKCKHLSCPFRQNAQMECISSFVILTNTIFVQYNTEKSLLFGRK